jgi:REP element-mobilizing transposase RayT
MTRPLRLQFPGALYHVTSRGNRRSHIYRDDSDRIAWLGVLALVCERYHCVVHSFCLMSNHFHLMLETVEPNLARAMRHLNGEYTQHFNRRHHTVGHLFQGRYKAILVQKESYLLELSRYIVLNPLRAKMVDRVEEWPWSSHRYYLGDGPAPPWLERDWLLSQFGSCRTQAVAAYLAFVAAGIDRASPLLETRHQVLLGDDDFVSEHQHLQQSEELVETLRVERAAVALSLGEYRSRFPDRTEAMARAYLSMAFTMPMIAVAFGVSAKTVGRAVRAWEAAGKPIRNTEAIATLGGAMGARENG